MQYPDRPKPRSKSACLQSLVTISLKSQQSLFSSQIQKKKIGWENLSRLIQSWSRTKNGYSLLIAMADSHACNGQERSCVLIWNEERINWAYQISDPHLFPSSYGEIFQIWSGEHLPLASLIKCACDCDMQQHSKDTCAASSLSSPSSSSEVKVGPDSLLLFFLYFL